MIVIVDVNTGNLGSIRNVVHYLGHDAIISSDKDVIRQATKLILPGIGAFDTGMRTLHQYDLITTLNHKALEEKTPVLGICLGMQMMCTSSEESESKQQGLGWFNVPVIKFKAAHIKVPQMGWNTITITQQIPLLKNVTPDARFYFCHSYHADTPDKAITAATTDYGYAFPSVLVHNNLLGVQFHPEKSHDSGVNLLRNFLENY